MMFLKISMHSHLFHIQSNYFSDYTYTLEIHKSSTFSSTCLSIWGIALDPHANNISLFQMLVQVLGLSSSSHHCQGMLVLQLQQESFRNLDLNSIKHDEDDQTWTLGGFCTNFLEFAEKPWPKIYHHLYLVRNTSLSLLSFIYPDHPKY